MFGHERGAFTGATDRRIGRFELADTGTLLLDEVGDLGAEAQAKLLRAIEASEIERVGGGKPIKVDVRIVAATNMDLDARRGRGDVPRGSLPPAQRDPDRRCRRCASGRTTFRALVRHFSALYRTRTGRPAPAWSEDAIALLTRHRWPGNVRELANIVERLAILHAGRR